MSGYVLSHSFMITGDSNKIWRAVVKRYPRLMMPVLASLIFAWCVRTLVGYHYQDVMNYSGSTMHDMFNVDRSFLYVINEGVFGTFFRGDFSLNPPIWTIATELKGSFFVFGLLALFRRSPLRWVGYVAAALLLYDRYYLAFPIGIALAALPRSKTDRPCLAAACAVVGVMLGSYPYYGVDQGLWHWLPRPWNAPSFDFYHIIGAGFLFEALILSQFKTLFDRRIFRLLGRISYSLYLTHFTILSSLSAWLVLWAEPQLGYLPAVFLAGAISFPIMLVTAYGFTRAIDAPAVQAADRLTHTSLRLWARSNRLMIGRRRTFY
jgi:peptidoglycan/LPS O-acetylase OafA/YrhL